MCFVLRVRAARNVRKFRSDFPTQDEEKRRQSQACAPLPCNLRSEFMITLPDREMLYVTRIFNGQYLMVEHRPSRLALTIHRPPSTLPPVVRGKRSASYSLFIAVNSPRFFQFRYVRTCIDAPAAAVRSYLDLSTTRSWPKI